MTDADQHPHRPVRSAAARIAARYSDGSSPDSTEPGESSATGAATDVIGTVGTDRPSPGGGAPGAAPSAATPDLPAAEPHGASARATDATGPIASVPAGSAPTTDAIFSAPASSAASAAAAPSTPGSSATPATSTTSVAPTVVHGDSTPADPSTPPSTTTASAVGRLPRLAAGGRIVHVLGLLAVGLVTAFALVILGPVVTRLSAATSTREFTGMVLVGLGAVALVGFSRWLDHVLAGRLARRYAESLLARVVERAPDHPASVSRLAVHSLRAVRESVAHLHARLIPLVVLLVGAGTALALVHRSLPLVAAAPLLILGAVAASMSTAASRAVRDERRARHDVTAAVAPVLAPPEPEVEPVPVQSVVAGTDLAPEPGEDAVADTLDPVDDDALVAARGSSRASGSSDAAGSGSPTSLPSDLRAALGRLADAENRAAEALGSLRAVGAVVLGAELAVVALAATAAGVPAGEIAGALVVVGIATAAATDVAEGARFAPAMKDARRAVGRALTAGEAARTSR
ncbi:MAG: hypothetical protein ACTHYM_08670 [Actinomycetaceae bacterium]